MPVMRISASVDWSVNNGAGWWIGRRCSWGTGPASSAGAPRTFDMGASGAAPAGPRHGVAADGPRDRLAGVSDLLAAHEALARVHGDGAHRRLAEMLGDLKYQAMALILRLERVEDGRQMPFEVHVDDCADHLRDVPDWICHGWSLLLRRYRRLRVHTASAPEMISISSFVIIAWRVRL